MAVVDSMLIGAIRVEVSIATSPAGHPCVLLQVGDDWYLGLNTPGDARTLGRMLLDAARELDTLTDD